MFAMVDLSLKWLLFWPETLHLVSLLKIDGCVLSEESCSVGLPLGVEYERKKQRLQQELRMDYRRYMAQVTVRLHLFTLVFGCSRQA